METREIYELAKKSYPNFMIAVEAEEGFVFYNDEHDAWRIKQHHAEFRGEEEPEDSGDTYAIPYNELRELMPYFNQAEGLRVLMCEEEEGEIVVRELVVDHSVREEELGRIATETPLTDEQKAKCWDVYKDLCLTQMRQAQDVWAQLGNKNEILESLYESAERAVRTFERLTR